MREVLEAILKEVSERFDKMPDIIPRRQFTGHKLEMEKASNERVLRSRHITWLTLFQASGVGPLSNPIDVVALTRDPHSPIVHFLLYLISMETFLPAALADAAVNRDTSKIETMGLIAFLLKELLWNV